MEEDNMTRKTFYGTHRGEFWGVPPTGRQVTIDLMDVVRIADDQIVEHWNVVDWIGLMHQLQAASTPGATRPSARAPTAELARATGALPGQRANILPAHARRARPGRHAARQPGRPDRQGCPTRAVRCRRHLRRHPTLGRDTNGKSIVAINRDADSPAARQADLTTGSAPRSGPCARTGHQGDQ
jgi:SnoaL-like polyketide cyclase